MKPLKNASGWMMQFAYQTTSLDGVANFVQTKHASSETCARKIRGM